MVGGNDPLTGNVGSRFEHIRRVQVTQVLWFEIDLLITGCFQCHDTALSRGVLQSQDWNCHGRVGLGGNGFCGRRFGSPVVQGLCGGGLCGKRLPKIDGQCQVARHRPVQNNLPQVDLGTTVTGVRKQRMTLFDDSCRRVYWNDLDLLADRHGQRKGELPYLSMPDVQVELVVYVQLATIEPHKSQRFRRHLRRFRSDLKPAANTRVVLITVLQGSTRSLSGSSVRPVGGHRLQVVRQVGHLQLDVGRCPDQHRPFNLVGTNQPQFGQRQLTESFILLQGAVEMPLGRQCDFQRLAGAQWFDEIESYVL